MDKPNLETLYREALEQLEALKKAHRAELSKYAEAIIKASREN